MATRPEAIASQLRQRIRVSLHMGALQPGDRLPSVRAFARRHRTDVRAVLEAYHLLASERLVQIRARSGIVVAPSVESNAAVLPQVGQRVVEFFTHGLSSGITLAELHRQVRRCFDTVTVSAACVECNFDQIHALCWELERDYGIRTKGVEADALSSRSAAAALGRVHLVVTTRFHEDAVRDVLGGKTPPLVVVSLSSAFRAEIARVLAVEPLYFLCTDPRFAAKLPRIFAGQGDVRPIVLAEGVPDRLPPDACIYSMHSALERLPAGWQPRRLLCAPRVFSAATAQELITHVVRINLEAASGRSSETNGAS